jgi:hypothetical protein
VLDAKRRGLSVKEIQHLTGLSEKEIKSIMNYEL